MEEVPLGSEKVIDCAAEGATEQLNAVVKVSEPIKIFPAVISVAVQGPVKLVLKVAESPATLGYPGAVVGVQSLIMSHCPDPDKTQVNGVPAEYNSALCNKQRDSKIGLTKRPIDLLVYYKKVLESMQEGSRIVEK